MEQSTISDSLCTRLQVFRQFFFDEIFRQFRAGQMRFILTTHKFIARQQSLPVYHHDTNTVYGGES